MEEKKEEKKEDLIELTESEKLRVERGLKAKEFLESEFFRKFMLPAIEKKRISEYPKPTGKGWEDKYRLAYAKDEVYTELLSDIQAWTKEAEALKEKEGKPTKDIMNA